MWIFSPVWIIFTHTLERKRNPCFLHISSNLVFSFKKCFCYLDQPWIFPCCTLLLWCSQAGLNIVSRVFFLSLVLLLSFFGLMVSYWDFWVRKCWWHTHSSARRHTVPSSHRAFAAVNGAQGHSYSPRACYRLRYGLVVRATCG